MLTFSRSALSRERRRSQIAYFNMTPVDFFAPLGAEDTPYNAICERLRRLRSLDNADLEKVSTLLDWIAEQKNKA